MTALETTLGVPERTLAPRVAAGSLRSLGIVNWTIARLVSRAAGTPNAQLFSTLGRHKKLFRAWLGFSAHLMPGGLIGRHETELVILRVAHLRQCDYERDHHLRLARRVGIDAAIAARVIEGPRATAWSERHRALLYAVDALVRHKNIDDDTWALLRQHYDEAQLIELCMLVGQYEMLATTIATLRIPRDF